MPDPIPRLRVRRAMANNLQDLDLDLPLGRWIALTGPSGSGKTTLAFDVLHRESQRRYLGGRSVKALQTLGKLGSGSAELSGLPVSLATGASAVRANPRSTVGTLTGLSGLLRLLFAREGVHPTATRKTRSHFSFNHELGACAHCRGLGVEDLVDPELLVADASKTIRDGALRPTLPNGYTVYSQVTVDVMDDICRAHGFDVDTPWQELTDAQRHVIFHGTTALQVPFGKHGLESRMKWSGITARPREVGYYKGLIPVIEATLARDRNPNILRYVRSVDCSVCGGTRLGPIGRETRVGDWTLPAMSALPLSELAQVELPDSAVLTALRSRLDARLARLEQLSLGHLTLSRRSATLSGGEAQRLRLATQVAAGLGGLLYVLDEPTLGLDPGAQPGMAAVLEELLALGNTLLVVEHDPAMARRADHWVALGPGAGSEGGRVVADAPMRPGALDHHWVPPAAAADSLGNLCLRGASLHNLQDVDLEVPLGRLTVVSGPSGAGKSSLVLGSLLPALRGDPGAPSLHGVPDSMAVHAVDAKPIGKTSRSTPATYTGLFDKVRKLFARLPAAKEAGLAAGRFSYNDKRGRCERCAGLGVVRVGMHLLADVERVCDVCDGARYRPEVLAVQLRGQSIAQVLQMTAAEAERFFAPEPELARMCGAMVQLGLGYLPLGQPSSSLSRGEAQRIKLATLLAQTRAPAVVLLDEPDRGLHPDDVLRLLGCLDALTDASHTVVCISHHPMLWAHAHQRVALEAGRLVAPPSPPELPEPARRPVPALPAAIELCGVRTHNLQDLDARFAHGAVTVVTGVSGSGKSSLVFDTLAAEAWARFAESLPFEVRRHLRQLAQPQLKSAAGLTPVIALRQGDGVVGPRSTVGTLTRIDRDLRLWFSRCSDATGLTAAHFSPEHALGACPQCAGRGEQLRCDPARLLTHPERSLFDGAMAGTKPGRFLGEPDGQYLATLREAARVLGVEVDGPVRDLSPQARALALEGAGELELEVTWHFSRGKRSGTHHFTGPWVGLLALVEEQAALRVKRKDGAQWQVPLVAMPCASCAGERLMPAARQARLGGHRLPSLRRLPLTALHAVLSALPSEPVLDALRPALSGTLAELDALGLGHLSLDRRSQTLSRGELQRLRLAGVLGSGLTQVTLVLDEPGTGLDEARLQALSERLRDFCAAGNTVVMVSHRASLIEGAEHVLTLGPGAGAAGGRWVERTVAPEMPLVPALPEHGWVRITGAHAHTLDGLDVALPDRGLTVLTGPSGSGKSTLLHAVLGASVEAGQARGCDQITGLDRFTRVLDGRAGRSRSPLSTLGLSTALRKRLYSVGSGLPARAFALGSPAGRCPRCKGAGSLPVAMDFMADLALTCPVCQGTRLLPEVHDVRWLGWNLHEWLIADVRTLVQRLPSGPLLRACQLLVELGLGHVGLDRPGETLSPGEHQRVLLASVLCRADGPTLLLLDEPGSGLHAQDLARVVEQLFTAVAAGHCIVASSHRRGLIASAQHVVDLPSGSSRQP